MAKRAAPGKKATPARSEHELELEARIVALEYLVKQCFWQTMLDRIYREVEDDPDLGEPNVLVTQEAIVFRKKIVNDLKSATFRGRGAALSDHLAALVRDHAERIVEELVQSMAAKQDPRQSSPGSS